MADIKVVLTATDNMSGPIKKIGTAADGLGKELQQAGQEGSRGLKQIDDAARQSVSGMERMKASAVAIGAAVGTMASGMAIAGAAFRDQQRQVTGITALYGDAADEMLAFAETVQSSLGFSNDAAREAMLISSSLVSNYQMSAEQVQQIIARAADLAAVFGTSLDDAVQRVSGAIRGEGEAAEMLGLNLSDAAVAARALQAGITNWNVPGALTEAEKAAFRFQLLMEDTADTVGIAEQRAESAGGKFREFANEIQDGVQAVGDFLGPIGEIAAEFQAVALWLPPITAGMGKFVQSMQTGGLAASALRSPLASIGVAGGVATVAYLGMVDQIQASISASEDLDKVWDNLKLDGLDTSASQLEAVRGQINGIISDLAEGNTSWLPFGTGGIEVPAEVRTKIAQTLAIAFTDARVDTEAFVAWVNSELARIGDDQEARIDFLNSLTDPSILIQFRTDMEGVTDATEGYTTALQQAAAANVVAGEAAQAHREALEGMVNSLDKAGAAAEVDTFRMDRFSKSLEDVKAKGRDTFDDLNESIREANEATADWIENSPDSGQFLDFWLDYEQALTETDAAQQQATSSVRELMQSGIEIGDTWGGNVVTLGSLRGEVGRLGEDVAAADRSFESLIAQGGELESFGDGLRRVGTEVAAWDFSNTVALANAIEDTGAAVDRVLDTFDRIDNLGQRAESGGSIADTLIGEPGEIGELQDLFWRMEAGLTEFTLSYDDYNAAIAAGVSLQERNLRIQDDLNVIRAEQLPLLDQEMAAYEANLDALSQLPADQQRYALALQDTAVQQQIAAQYATAYSAAVGEIPEQVATDVIVNSAKADPLLADLLVKMGLLNEVWGPDGTKTYTVNFPDAESTASAVDRLTEAVIALGDVLDNGKRDLSFTTNAPEIGVQIADLTKSLPDKIEFPVEMIPVVGDGTGGPDTGGILSGVIPGDLSIDLTVNADTEPARAMITTLEDEAPTVTAPVEADTSQASSDIAGLSETAPTVSVKAEIDWGSIQTANPQGQALAWEQSAITVTITADDQAAAVIDGYRAMEGTSLATMSVTIDLTDNAADKIAYYESPKGGNGAPLGTMTVTIDAVDNASAIITDVTNAANAIPDSESVEVSAPGAAIATSLLSGVTGAALSIPDSASVSVSAIGAAEAASALYNVASAANSIPSSVSTTVTTNQVTNVVTNFASTGTRAVRHGGIPGLATGGILFEGGEIGPEILHLATGGTVPLPQHAYYIAPPNSYVSPNNAAVGQMGGGGISLSVHVAGHVIGVSDLTEQIAAELLPAIARESQTYRTAITGGPA